MTVTLLSITYKAGPPIPQAVYTDSAVLQDHIGNLTEGYKFEGYDPTHSTMKQISIYSKTVNIKGQGEFTQILSVECQQIEYYERAGE